jgi:hypothetical protein
MLNDESEIFNIFIDDFQEYLELRKKVEPVSTCTSRDALVGDPFQIVLPSEKLLACLVNGCS